MAAPVASGVNPDRISTHGCDKQWLNLLHVSQFWQDVCYGRARDFGSYN